jgi:type VI secretion system protein ImpB
MPGEKSHQHKLDRVRPPRVQITYDVETNGSPVKKELPFVLGVMADLAGHPDPDQTVEQLKDRVFTEINRDTFDNVMATRDRDDKDKIIGGIRPRLALRVPNELQKDGSKIGIELKFESIEDFEPENIVNKVKPLKDLLEIRRKLSDLKLKAISNDKLDSVLQKIIQATEELRKKGLETPGTTTEGEA